MLTCLSGMDVENSEHPCKKQLNTAKKIREKFTKDLYVWCDYSVQHIYPKLPMQAFKMAGIEFVAAIPVLSNNLSKRENDCTIAYCEQRNIGMNYLHIDVEELFNGHEFRKVWRDVSYNTTQMTIAGKYFDMLSDCCIVYPGFMMHVSTSEWTRTKNNGFMSFVPTPNTRTCPRSGKEYTNFPRTLCRHVH